MISPLPDHSEVHRIGAPGVQGLSPATIAMALIP
jgi:hypothetical protein